MSEEREASSVSSPILVEVGKAMLAAAVATFTAGWVARGEVATVETRVSVLEARMQAVDEIRTDVREIRSMLTKGRE